MPRTISIRDLEFPLASLRRTFVWPRRHKIYVALEGIDGSGKTTALTGIAWRLREKGYTVSEVRYTNKGTVIGKVIRYVYGEPQKIVPWLRPVRNVRLVQAILYGFNGRLNLCLRERNADVLLSDRSALSGYASHLGRIPMCILSLIEPFYNPDLILYFDLGETEALRRLVAERGTPGYEEDPQSLTEFREAYEALISTPPQRLRSARIERIDASIPRESVIERAVAIIAEALTMH